MATDHMQIVNAIHRHRYLGTILDLDEVIEDLGDLADARHIEQEADCEDCAAYDAQIRAIRAASYSLDTAKSVPDCIMALASIMKAIGSNDREAVSEAADFIARIRSIK